jgi:predicted kinase
MRKWMRERGKRRKKPSENLSEATGKVGQALDRNQPAPIVPSYGFDDNDDVEPSVNESPAPARATQPAAAPAAARDQRIEVETQPDSPNTPPAAPDAATRRPGQAQAQAQSKREPRGVVVLTIGLPGSGKTTWYKRRGVTPLSSDLLRNILFDSITEQRYQGLVFSTLRSLLRARLIAKMPWNYVDATNLSPHERRQWIKMARGFGYEVHAVFFDVPLELCLERNRKRERQVPEDVMKQMAQRLKPPTFKEGFSKIVVVRVKQE